MGTQHIIVIGGGAAGFFAAIAAAEQGAAVTVLEKTSRFLDKVRISGGGRCNVTHTGFDPREFATRYPRGEKALLAPFLKFSARDTVKWFASRGVKLKTEPDGRMFPISDSSRTIVDCLMRAAQSAGVKLRLNCGVERVIKLSDGRFEIALASKLSTLSPCEERAGREPERGVAGKTRLLSPALSSGLAGREGEKFGEVLACDRLLLATGGCRVAVAGQLAVSLGHTLEPPVPSLFAFHVKSPWLRSLAGVSVDPVEVSAPAAKLRERGPLLVTHEGLSGPAILRLSAWGARTLHNLNYHFPLFVNWLPELPVEKITREIQARRAASGAKLVVNVPLAPLPARLWEQLVLAAGIARETRWSALTRLQTHALTQQLARTELAVTGKSLNKEEFVTCGGVRLAEVDFKTMESKVCPGLFFAGELLDIDGLTGGFNFQAAWTTGWIAGKAMVARGGYG
jgi:predicted flavoprotein YhiN